MATRDSVDQRNSRNRPANWDTIVSADRAFRSRPTAPGLVKTLLFLLCAPSLICVSPPVRAATRSAVIGLDPRVNALLAPDSKLVTLYEHDTIFGAPAWVRAGRSGYLIFSDVPGDVIDKLNPDGSVSSFLKNIFTGRNLSEAFQSFGRPGQKRFRMLGADGITIDRQGRVVYCAYSDGQIVRLERDGRRTVLASRFAGMRLNAPNDLVYGSDGSLYFTDSRADTKRTDGRGVPHEGLYVLRAGKVILLSKTIDHPNGVALSPDQRYLYVANTLRKNILRFDVKKGSLANEAIFIDMNGMNGIGAPDGIAVDKRGDVYSAGPGGVWVISPPGKHLGTIRTPMRVSKLAFGGKDCKTLYIAAFGALYRIRLKVAGR